MTDQPFNQLTDAESERLALLLEEMGEAQQAIGKILRHGYQSKNPDDRKSISNRTDLTVELSHVRAAINICVKAGDVYGSQMERMESEKRFKVGKYFHHQGDEAV